jgi:hypothetical protein
MVATFVLTNRLSSDGLKLPLDAARDDQRKHHQCAAPNAKITDPRTVSCRDTDQLSEALREHDRAGNHERESDNNGKHADKRFEQHSPYCRSHRVFLNLEIVQREFAYDGYLLPQRLQRMG